uniref:Excinuclease ABC subunit A n=1 Tax=uncultured bacterium 35A20 TaxID=1194347 RepID=K7PES1_9BACT|nr:excinuclease ABC subunit A [uncultured bacterium 35A20]
MKRVVLVLVVFLAATAFAFAGGGQQSSSSGDGAPPYNVDLSTLPMTKNTVAMTKAWEDFIIPLPELPGFDATKYSRVTINAKYYGADGSEMTPSDSKVMVTLIYDVNGDIRGPEMGAGPNTPLKEFNVGGFSGAVSTDRGVRVKLTKQPGAINFQPNSGSNVAFIEITQLTFHNRTASGE